MQPLGMISKNLKKPECNNHLETYAKIITQPLEEERFNRDERF